jgi:Protein of unknown function (DUF1360)
MLLSQIEFGTFLLLGLAAFRLTRLIVFDQIMAPLRRPFFTEIEEKDEEGKTEIYIIPKEKGLRHWIGELLSCYWCTGVWVSVCLTFLYTLQSQVGEFLILLLAVAAIGSLIEVLVSKWLGN